MSAFLFDLRCAVRALRKNSFGGVVILAMALGIGSNTAMFSVANAVLLRPLPYEDPARLITLSEINLGDGAGRVPVSASNFVAWKAQSRTVDRMAAYRPWGYVLTGRGEPERLLGVRASADLFPLLGIKVIEGRTFTAADDTFGRQRVAVLSEGLWRRRFGGDASVIGRSLALSDESYTVIGVLPHDSTLIDADVWVPLALEPFALQQRGTRALTVVGRLQSGVTQAQAQAEMHGIASELARRFPDGAAAWDVAVVSLTEHLVGSVRPTMLMVWAAIALVLLIACANTANLLLARGGRQHEVAICLALGANRWRVVRQLLIESILLAFAGSIAGVPLAVAGVQMLALLGPANLPRLDEIRLDVAAFAFTLSLSLLAGALFGLVPALRSLRAETFSTLKEASSATLAGPTRSAFRNIALSGQLALAVVVLIGAGLLVRSFERLMAADRGFAPDRVLTMAISLSGQKYNDDSRRAAFFDELIERVESVPGVETAGLTSHLPLAGRRLSMDFTVAGGASSPGRALWADCSSVSDDFFRVMSIPLRTGRVFSALDTSRSAPVVVINQEMADQLWPHGSPVGRRLVVGTTTGADQRPREIVGVVANVRSASLETAPGFQMYVPSSQHPWPTMTLVVRASGEPAALAGPIRTELLAVDPNQPIYNIRSLEQVISRAVALRRFQTVVLVVFGVAGLVLATIGVYSVAACTVRLRTREIGLRLAIGARGGDVVMLIIRGGIIWIVAGIIAGAAVAIWAGRLLRGMLFGIASLDPLTFVSVTSFVALLALTGSAVAARRAARVDPLIALRGD
jgi:putative ABC transport system permease protein